MARPFSNARRAATLLLRGLMIASLSSSTLLGNASRAHTSSNLFTDTVGARMLPSPISAEAILQRFKAVTGGNAWDSVETLHTIYQVTSGGLTGTSDEWDDVLGGRTVSHETMGGTRDANGFDGKRAWHQDDTGPAHPDDGPAEAMDAVSDAYDTSNSYWYPNRVPGRLVSLGQVSNPQGVYDVVRVEPTGGTAYQMWFDRSTGFMVKTVEQTATQTSISIYSDYKAIGGGSGIELPYRLVQSDGDPRFDTVETILSAQANAAPPRGVFDMPTQFAPDYRFADGASSVTVPIQYVDDHIYIPLKINGHAAMAMFDTGGSFIVSTQAARDLGLKPEGAVEVAGNGSGSVSGGLARAETVEIGGLTIKRPVFTTIPYFGGEGDEPVVGSELLDRFVIGIDFDHDTMTLSRPDAYHFSGRGVVVPFRFHEGHMPVVDGSIDGVAGTFTIDTGDNLALTLNGPFSEANDLKAKYQPKFTAISGYGIGGADPASVVRTQTLTLGGVSVHDRVTYLRGGKSGAGADRYVSGNVGNGVLRQFNLTFDYPAEQIVFQPNTHYGEPDVYQRSGIIFDIHTVMPTIADVVPGSPAADAGLAVGDLVTGIDGISVQSAGFTRQFQEFNFQPAGSKVNLRVTMPGGRERSVTITLRDLI